MTGVPAELRTWVDDIGVLSGAGGIEKFVHVPDVAAALVFRTTGEGRSDLIVVGPRSRGSYHPGKPLPVCIRLRVRPGRSRVLFGLPINELADRAIPLTDLWGVRGRRLADDLAAAPDRALTRIAAALHERDTGTPDGAALESAMRVLSSGAPIAAAAAQLGISERQLRNVFARDIGLSPKHFARIARLRRVLALANDQRATGDPGRARAEGDPGWARVVANAGWAGAAGDPGRAQAAGDGGWAGAGVDPGWARVAGDLGYFDQAHMISDFRALMGVSPGAFVAGRLPPVSPCMELSRARHRPAGLRSAA